MYQAVYCITMNMPQTGPPSHSPSINNLLLFWPTWSRWSINTLILFYELYFPLFSLPLVQFVLDLIMWLILTTGTVLFVQYLWQTWSQLRGNVLSMVHTWRTTELRTEFMQLSVPLNQLSAAHRQLSVPLNQLSAAHKQLSVPLNQLSRPSKIPYMYRFV